MLDRPGCGERYLLFANGIDKRLEHGFNQWKIETSQPLGEDAHDRVSFHGLVKWVEVQVKME